MDILDHLQPVGVGQRNIRQHQAGPQFGDQVQRLTAGPGLPADGQLGVRNGDERTHGDVVPLHLRVPAEREKAQSAVRLAGLLERICDQTISGKLAKEVFEAMWSGGADADAVIAERGLKQITDSAAIERAIEEVLQKNPGQLAEYRAGKDKLFGFFVGQVMKATGGKANPAQLNELLKKKLGG